MVLTILVLLLFAIFSLGCVLVVLGTFRKNRWGINTAQLTCPNCGNALGHVRMPKTMAQFLWGGATCSRCGVEVDKWGRSVNQSVPSS
jgi:hypothetical protein